jgi:hypothetical protein
MENKTKYEAREKKRKAYWKKVFKEVAERLYGSL